MVSVLPKTHIRTDNQASLFTSKLLFLLVTLRFIQMHIYDFQLYNLNTNHRTVLGSTFKCERWGYQVRELYLALQILYLRGMRGDILSQYIPEEARSTIMNFFHIPLNIFVCIVLYNVNAFPMTVMFVVYSIFLFMASILQKRLMVIAESHKSRTHDWTSMKERESEAGPLNI